MITALYDGYCVICQATRRTIKALDWGHRVEFLDLHAHDAVRARYPHLEHTSLMGEIHVIDGEGRLYAGFMGTRRLLREVPLGFPVWLLLQLPFMTPLGKRIYRFIARRRYAVNRFFGVTLQPCDDDQCRIP